MAPISLHTEAHGKVGNAVGALAANLGTHLSDPGARFEAVTASMNEGKSLLRVRSEPPTLTASEGTVSGASIGACVQVDGYDLDLLSTEVSFVDNGLNLDSTSLPVPGAADPIGDL